MKLFYYEVFSLVLMLIGNYAHIVLNPEIMTYAFGVTFIILFICVGVIKGVVNEIPDNYLNLECFKVVFYTGLDLVDKYLIAILASTILWAVDVIMFPCGLGAISFFVLSVCYAIYNIIYTKKYLNKFYKLLEENQYVL